MKYLDANRCIIIPTRCPTWLYQIFWPRGVFQFYKELNVRSRETEKHLNLYGYFKNVVGLISQDDVINDQCIDSELFVREFDPRGILFYLLMIIYNILYTLDYQDKSITRIAIVIRIKDEPILFLCADTT